jgi:hypothetical protein
MSADETAITALLPGKAALSYFGGYSFHDLLRTDDRWRSRHLREEAVWSVNGPTSRE